VNDHDKSPDQAQDDEYGRDGADLLNLLDTVDRHLTPEHIAQRYRELLNGPGDAERSTPCSADWKVAIRDFKHPDNPFLAYTAAEWQAFIAAVKTGDVARSGVPVFATAVLPEAIKTWADAHRRVEDAQRYSEEMQDTALEKAARIEAEARDKAERIEAEARDKAEHIEAEARDKAERIEAETLNRSRRIIWEARQTAAHIEAMARPQTEQLNPDFYPADRFEAVTADVAAQCSAALPPLTEAFTEHLAAVANLSSLYSAPITHLLPLMKQAYLPNWRADLAGEPTDAADFVRLLLQAREIANEPRRGPGTTNRASLVVRDTPWSGADSSLVTAHGVPWWAEAAVDLPEGLVLIDATRGTVLVQVESWPRESSWLRLRRAHLPAALRVFLESPGRVLIEGTGGTGKAHLAAKLAQARAQKAPTSMAIKVWLAGKDARGPVDVAELQSPLSSALPDGP
jgi:hypothetical protein